MKLLAIDTSTDLATVALVAHGMLFTEEQPGIRQHAQVLLPMIERVLAQADLACHQLDAIVFGRGPGSFTGLRIACSVAKGLAYAHHLPVYPVSSLAAIAYAVYHAQEGQLANVRVLAMIDARMQQVYWGCFSGVVEAVSEQVTGPEDIHVPEGEGVILAGVGFEPYTSLLPKALQTRILTQHTLFPTACAMIRLVQAGHIQSVSAALAMPVYVRNQVTQGASRG